MIVHAWEYVTTSSTGVQGAVPPLRKVRLNVERLVAHQLKAALPLTGIVIADTAGNFWLCTRRMSQTSGHRRSRDQLLVRPATAADALVHAARVLP